MTKLTLTQTKWLLAITVLGGLLVFVADLGAYSTGGFVVAMLALYRLLRWLEGERNWKAIQGALNGYEEIIHGQLWRGTDAEVLASDRVDDPTKSGPVRFEHICRTKNGAWFLFEVAVTHGRVIDRHLRPCDEAMAQSRLRRHQEAYVRSFGQPTDA